MSARTEVARQLYESNGGVVRFTDEYAFRQYLIEEISEADDSSLETYARGIMSTHAEVAVVKWCDDGSVEITWKPRG